MVILLPVLTSAQLEGEGGKRTKGSSFLNPFFSKIFSSFFAHFLAPSPLSSSLVFVTFCLPTSEKIRRKKEQLKEFVGGGGQEKSPARENEKKSFLHSLCTFHGKEGKTSKPLFCGGRGFSSKLRKTAAAGCITCLFGGYTKLSQGTHSAALQNGTASPPPPRCSLKLEAAIVLYVQ